MSLQKDNRSRKTHLEASHKSIYGANPMGLQIRRQNDWKTLTPQNQSHTFTKNKAKSYPIINRTVNGSTAHNASRIESRIPSQFASQSAAQSKSRSASQANDQAALEYFTKVIWSSISRLPNFWRTRDYTAQYECQTGLTFGFQSQQDKCYIEISLTHLTKDEIVELLKQGQLHDELLTLNELAHLPFVEYGLMNIDGLDFDIVDYVRIRLDLVIDPKNHRQYLENWDFMLSRSQTWDQLNHSAADFLKGLENLKRA